MGFEDANNRSIDILHSKAELTVVLILACQDPASTVGLPDAVRYALPGAPIGDVLLCAGHRVEGHAHARWLLGREARCRPILGRRLWRRGGVWESCDGSVEDR